MNLEAGCVVYIQHYDITIKLFVLHFLSMLLFFSVTRCSHLSIRTVLTLVSSLI